MLPVLAAISSLAAETTGPPTVTFTDYRGQHPGTVHKITPSDLPPPYATPSVADSPRLVDKPAAAWPLAPAGFKVALYASGLDNPRLIRTAPNGDLFLAESRPGRIKVFRGVTEEGKPQAIATFATGLNQPFGIAFYPPGPNPEYVYVANTDSVVRFAYESGALKANGPARMVIRDLPGGGRLRGGGHWTRDIAFSLDGRKLFVSVGSLSNVDDTDNNP
ncbi:MAG TPA: hypothetical protein VKE49_12920, partial [Myxococcaceae bacterium]|nr:hypothetical protein [Myxococcaceae bacterium]